MGQIEEGGAMTSEDVANAAGNHQAAEPRKHGKCAAGAIEGNDWSLREPSSHGVGITLGRYFPADF